MKASTKYLVWYMISPVDGYSITQCDTWEAALAAVEKTWGAGSAEKLQSSKSGILYRGKGLRREEICITSPYLTKPL